MRKWQQFWAGRWRGRNSPGDQAVAGGLAPTEGEWARRSSWIGLVCGFTLIELLIAVSITALLAGIMLAVVAGTLALWHRTQDDFSTSVQAKIALDLIERDLQAAYFRPDGGTWLAIDVSNTPALLVNHGWLPAASGKPAGVESQRLLPVDAILTPAIGQARFGLSGAWARFVTTNAEAGGSLPVAVSYQIARRPVSGAVNVSNPAEVRYTLFRAAVSAENSFGAGNDVTASAYQSVSSTPTATRSLRTMTNPNNSDALVSNAVDFGLWLYVRDGANGLRRIFPADNADFSHAARDGSPGPDSTRFPEVAEVMIRILGDRGAGQIAEMEAGAGRLVRPAVFATDAEWWWSVVEGNSRVYVRRIEIKRSSQ